MRPAKRLAAERRPSSRSPCLNSRAATAAVWRASDYCEGGLSFDPDWTGPYVDLTRRTWTLKTLPRYLRFGEPSAKLKYALQPVFGNHAVPWTPPPLCKAATPLVAIWLVAALFIAVLLIFAVFSN